MEVRILGPLEFSGPSGAVTPGGRKGQAILAALVIHSDRVVSVDRLIDLLWGDDPPETALKTLRSHVSRLRARLGSDADAIETVTGGYMLRSEGHVMDVRVFDDRIEEAEVLRVRGRHRDAVRRVDEALALWRGPPFHGLDDLDIIHQEAIRLEERRIGAIETRIASLISMGRHEAVVADLEQLVEQHPLREGMWRLLMVALYRSGRQADALRAYQRARRHLGEELGLEPGPELRSLEEAILLQRKELDTPSAEISNHNLPAAKSTFIGREDDIADLDALLDGYRCVTVSGAGGSGKTRLAIEAARRRVERYPDGSTLIELAAVSDPEVVAAHVGNELGEVGALADDATTAIVQYLANREQLLILDNCEHLIITVAEVVDAILAGCPGITVLATSREPLHIDGEAVFSTPPLDVPDEDAEPSQQEATEAFRLFVDRATALDRGFRVDADNRTAIATICRTLDGIPLAIELAAARSRAMSVAEIAGGMDDLFELLSDGRRTAPPRHKTLRAAIDWSYQLCPPLARTTLCRLSVFAGGWTMDAATSVIADDEVSEEDVTRLLNRLVDQSLIEWSETDGGSRFHMLETIRQFAFDELVATGEAPRVARRHRDWCLTLAEPATPALRGPDQVAWWQRLESEHDNLRAALRWSLNSGDHSELFRLVAALGWFWFMRGHWREAWRWADACQSLGPEPDALGWVRVVHATGSIEVIRGNLEPLDAPLARALELSRNAGSRIDEAWCLHYLGHAGTFRGSPEAGPLIEQGLEIFEAIDEAWAVAWSWRYLGQTKEDVEESIELQQRALDQFLEMGDRWCASYSLYLLGNTLIYAGRLGEAESSNSRALELARDLGDTVWAAHATGRLGAIAVLEGDNASAVRLLGDGLDMHRRLGDETCVAVLSSYLGLAQARDGRTEEARRSYIESLRISGGLGNKTQTAVTVGRLADLAAADGSFDDAGRMYGATTAPDVAQALSTASLFVDQRSAIESRLRANLEADRYERLVDEGAQIGLESMAARLLDEAGELGRGGDRQERS